MAGLNFEAPNNVKVHGKTGSDTLQNLKIRMFKKMKKKTFKSYFSLVCVF